MVENYQENTFRTKEDLNSFRNARSLVDMSVWFGTTILYGVATGMFDGSREMNDPATPLIMVGGIWAAFIATSVVHENSTGYVNLLRNYYSNSDNLDLLNLQ